MVLLLLHLLFHIIDMNPEERAIESLLLKDRWSLITSGMDRKDIHIPKTRIYIKHELVGIVKARSRLFGNQRKLQNLL